MQSFPALVAAVLLGGAVAATGAYVLLSPGPRTEAAGAPVAAPTSLDAELLARLDALAEENRELRERLADLELRPAPVARAPIDGFVTKEEFEAFREELRGEEPSSPELSVREPTAFKEHVADALSVIRKEEAVEKVRAYQEKREARLEEDVTRIRDWLELSPYQADEMRSALQTQYDREAEVMRMWEEGVDDEIVGEQKRADGELFWAEVGVFLTPEQADTFRERVGAGRGKD